MKRSSSEATIEQCLEVHTREESLGGGGSGGGGNRILLRALSSGDFSHKENVAESQVPKSSGFALETVHMERKIWSTGEDYRAGGISAAENLSLEPFFPGNRRPRRRRTTTTTTTKLSSLKSRHSTNLKKVATNANPPRRTRRRRCKRKKQPPLNLRQIVCLLHLRPLRVRRTPRSSRQRRSLHHRRPRSRRRQLGANSTTITFETSTTARSNP